MYYGAHSHTRTDDRKSTAPRARPEDHNQKRPHTHMNLIAQSAASRSDLCTQRTEGNHIVQLQQYLYAVTNSAPILTETV